MSSAMLTHEQVKEAHAFLAKCENPSAFKYQVRQRELISDAIFRRSMFRSVKINCMIPQRT